MTYWLLTIILANGQGVHTECAYGSHYLCDKHANGRTHHCTRVTYESDR